MKKLLIAISLLIWPGLVFGAVTANMPITAQSIQRQSAQFTANPLTYKTVYTAGVNGSKVISVIGSSTDTVTAHIVNCSIFNGGINYALMSFNLPINAGSSAAASVVNVNGMVAASIVGLPLDDNGNPYIFLENGDTLQCTYNVALSNGSLNVTAFGVDF